MSSVETTILERIRKLLSKTAENGATQAEADMAMIMATRLMTEHNIAMADIDIELSDWITSDVTDMGRWLMEHDFAYQICNRFFYVKGIVKDINKDGCKRRKSFMFFGEKNNVESAVFVFNSLLVAFEDLFIAYKLRTGCSQKERRTFIQGVYAGFYDKMSKERERVAEQYSGNSGGLALLSAKNKMIQKYQESYDQSKMIPKKTQISLANGSEDTLQSGYEAGQKLNINRKIDKST